MRLAAARGLSDAHGPAEAGSFLRERRIAFDCTRAEFPRIFVHELFHFVWLRLGNRARRAFEALVEGELAAGARGELGWSAEWRKSALRRRRPPQTQPPLARILLRELLRYGRLAVLRLGAACRVHAGGPVPPAPAGVVC